MSTALPVIDISGLFSPDWPDRVAVAERLGRACRDTGFFLVTGHGVPAAVVTALFAEARRLFALPAPDRAALSIHRGGNNRGWFGLAEERLDPGAAADRKEGFNIGLELDPSDPEFGRPFRGANPWPALPGWRASMLDYFERCMAVGRALHRGFCLDLGLDEAFFAPALHRPLATLRLLRYPAADPMAGDAGKGNAASGEAASGGAASGGAASGEVASGGGAAGGATIGDAVGAGKHTDYGNLTILAVDGVAGLELRRRDGVWIEAPTLPDAFIINIGDCLMRWTDDVYVSTPHRVRVPDRERLSIAFFLDPNPDVVVAPVSGSAASLARYPPITGADYLRSRLDPTYDAPPAVLSAG